MKNTAYLIILIALMWSCNSNTDEPDAWGNFESTEIMISSENNGKIIHMPVRQGDRIHEGQLVAITDTSIIKLQMEELNASRNSVITRLNSIRAQNEIIEQQIKNLAVNIDRTKRMLKDSAATRKQLDDLTGQLKVLEKQKDANNTQKQTISSELDVFDSKKALLEEKLNKCYVKSPSKGTILEKYSEAGELSAAGKPLIKIGRLEEMKLKAYISGAQLHQVKIGQECTVRIDDGEKGYREMKGKVVHISDRAEFTPKIIQTKEERVHLVYAVKILVKNDGTLKNGMPGEAFFGFSKNRDQ